ncbi:hypothetical protein, partial [uncultured Oscillibacter sp.]|uniref:hypothetical protein n=1 Tax=uncultured Oscillibacter sp. TaxID=876091 RepID=UPI0027299C55
DVRVAPGFLCPPFLLPLARFSLAPTYPSPLIPYFIIFTRKSLPCGRLFRQAEAGEQALFENWRNAGLGQIFLPGKAI